MPIGDLLASITGEKPSPSPTAITRPPLPIPKRKAADELRSAPAIKVARTDSPPTVSSRPSAESPRPSPRPADRASNSVAKPASTSQTSTKPSASGSNRPAPSSAKNGVKPASTTAGKTLPTRPLDNRPVNTDSGPKAGQKKGSFAEVLARANMFSKERESFGKIQHKPIEKKPLTMKERKQLRADSARQARLASKQQSSGKYTGTAAASRSAASRPGQRPGVGSKAAGAKDKTQPAPEVKKIKKAALATTGYTGTARPSAAASKPGATTKAGRDARHEISRYGGPFSRPRRRDEEDDDLDDFIDYDEEEEPRYGGYGRGEYDSAEDESDMEAGISDIDEEEQRADREARLEDLREAKELERRKAEKEQRKRLLAKGGR